MLKKRRNILNYTPPKQSVWSVRLLQISIALIYPFSAVDKLYSDRELWSTGSTGNSSEEVEALKKELKKIQVEN